MQTHDNLVDAPNLLKAVVRSLFNEPVIVGFNIGRVVGYGEDDEDCYYIVDFPKYPNGKRVWVSCVGGVFPLTSLKNEGVTVPFNPSYPGEVWSDYSRIDSVLSLNGAPRVDDFIVEAPPKHQLDKGLTKEEKLLREIFGESENKS